jgi:hypothetical protein
MKFNKQPGAGARTAWPRPTTPGGQGRPPLRASGSRRDRLPAFVMGDHCVGQEGLGYTRFILQNSSVCPYSDQHIKGSDRPLVLAEAKSHNA